MPVSVQSMSAIKAALDEATSDPKLVSKLVEQGKLSLDSSKQLYGIMPELMHLKLLDNGKLVDKTVDITLRMLLTHTAGLGYATLDPRLHEYGEKSDMPAPGINFWEFSGNAKDILRMPLVNQPGSVFEYSTGIDWAGMVVERVSGLSLEQYFQQFIMAPLGLKNMSFFPNAQMHSNLISMLQRLPDGSTKVCSHLCPSSLLAETQEEKARVFCSGGGGIYGNAVEYCEILATLLNNGTSPTTKAQILQPSTVESMFVNQIPQFPDFARVPSAAPRADLANPMTEFYPQAGNPPQGWGLSFMLTIQAGETGRGRNTGWWCGLPNLYWWVDRERGVAGMICGQVVPFCDPHVIGKWFACEKAVYDGLH